jgi:hypothetical protein
MRKATPHDLPRLFELIGHMHAGSKFAAMGIGVDSAVARSLLLTAVNRHGGQHDGSTCCFVTEKDGLIEGFIIGILQRVYLIGNRLEANDLFLYVSPNAPRQAATKLLDGYLAWALSNPKVAIVKLSWTDAMGVDGEALEKLYKRKGLRRSGGIWERVGQ